MALDFFDVQFLFLLIAIFLLWLLRGRWRDDRRGLISIRQPPAPRKLPIVGNLHQLGKLPHRPLKRLAELHAAPIMGLRLGNVEAVVVSSAEAAEAVLKTHDAECCSRPAITSWTKLSYGGADMGFAPYGEKWRAMRKVCNTELFSARRVQYFKPIRYEEVALLIGAVADQSGSTAAPVNLTELLMSFNQNIITRMVIGRRSNKGMDDIFKMFQAAMSEFFIADYFAGLWWIDKLIGKGRVTEETFKALDKFYDDIIDKHKVAPAANRGGAEDFIDVLLAAGVKEDSIKGTLMNVFVAGIDTTTSSVEWVMSELIKNPEAMKRAKEELRQVLLNGGSTVNDMVNESDLERLPYIQAIVKETMRLHPPVPLLIHRETLRDVEICGFHVCRRTWVLVNAYAIGRSGASWVNPEEFRPDRFMDADCGGVATNRTWKDFRSIPFGGGRRICPGMQLGKATVELAVANLLHVFDWFPPPGTTATDLDMEEAPGITVGRKSPLLLVAKRASVHGACDLYSIE